MKLVVLMCAEEFSEEAHKMLNEVKVPAYSETNINGYKLVEDNESDNWFAGKHAMENSRLIFSMCEDKKAEELMEAIKKCKINKKNDHVYAFKLNLEKFIA